MQFWQLAILATCNFGNMHFWQLSILTTFSFDNFQFWLFSSKIFELIQQQQQHIDCMDLAIKKYPCVVGRNRVMFKSDFPYNNSVGQNPKVPLKRWLSVDPSNFSEKICCITLFEPLRSLVRLQLGYLNSITLGIRLEINYYIPILGGLGSLCN